MNKKGFTLIEILVSVGILATIGLLVAQSFFSSIRTSTKTEILKDVKQSGESALLTMTRMIQSAQEVTTPCTSEGTTLDTLEIVNPDGGATTFACALDGSVTRLASISATTEYLTDNRVTLGGDLCANSSLLFVCTSVAGVPSQIGISFSLSQAAASGDQFESASQSFEGTAVVRNERP